MTAVAGHTSPRVGHITSGLARAVDLFLAATCPFAAGFEIESIDVILTHGTAVTPAAPRVCQAHAEVAKLADALA